jgi:hypothetical protein
MGIKDESDRAAIMLAMKNYLSEKKINSYKYCSPSAPLEDEPCTSFAELEHTFKPSAPVECVVCMEIDVRFTYKVLIHEC